MTQLNVISGRRCAHMDEIMKTVETIVEKFDPEKHDIGTHVKAVTYHGMEIGKKDGKHFCNIILDI